MAENKAWAKIRDSVRGNLLKYSLRAFQALPIMDKPDILDIGCGSGVPTIELAKISGGIVTALDNDQSKLDLLAEKVRENQLEDRVKILNKSITKMDFPPESFNIIWSEGSIFVVGFKNGLKKWRKFIKPGGFLVVHDEKGDVAKKIKQIAKNGYKLIDHFIFSSDIWWSEYYEPLQLEIEKFTAKYQNNPAILNDLASDRREVKMYKKNPGRFSSVSFVMQKVDDQS
jgi:ubiquinone/menaquinone biosynthesis C-methylase UbiE